MIAHIGRNQGKTYGITLDDAGREVAIECFVCRRTSHHAMDVKHRYCGHCHVFHDDLDAETQWKERAMRTRQ